MCSKAGHVKRKCDNVCTALLYCYHVRPTLFLLKISTCLNGILKDTIYKIDRDYVNIF